MAKKGFSVRELVYIGLFGALWGALEMTLGATLHNIKFPFTGLVMGGLGMAVLLTGYYFVPKRGALLSIGLVTLILKGFSIGGVVLNPMIAIFMESLLAEIGLVIAGSKLPGYLMAGGLGASWNVIHPFFTQGVLAGQGWYAILQRTVSRGARMLGLSPNAVIAVMIALVAVYFIAGALGGLVGWTVSRAAARRLNSFDEAEASS